MGCLFGIIVSFLGASIFNIANGVPFLPLQTIWINFTVILSQAIGLGYGKPSAHLMEQPPRDANMPAVPRGMMVWLAGIGLVMGTVTLGVLTWAWGEHGELVARTMGLTTFLIAIVLLSFESRDLHRTMFDLEVFSDRTFLIATGISIGVIYLGTAFSGFQRVLGTTALSLNQWLVCLLAGSAVVVVVEIQKVVGRSRRADSVAVVP
jgi:Ca2+-transporting ATPase